MSPASLALAARLAGASPFHAAVALAVLGATALRRPRRRGADPPAARAGLAWDLGRLTRFEAVAAARRSRSPQASSSAPRRRRSPRAWRWGRCRTGWPLVPTGPAIVVVLHAVLDKLEMRALEPRDEAPPPGGAVTAAEPHPQGQEGPMTPTEALDPFLLANGGTVAALGTRVALSTNHSRRTRRRSGPRTGPSSSRRPGGALDGGGADGPPCPAEVPRATTSSP